MTPAEVAAEVLRRITEHPETHDQSIFVDPYGMDLPKHCWQPWYPTDVELWSQCGSTACVAGHTAAVAVQGGVISRREARGMHVEDIASRALGFPYRVGSRASARLFNTDIDHRQVCELLAELAEQ